MDTQPKVTLKKYQNQIKKALKTRQRLVLNLRFTKEYKNVENRIFKILSKLFIINKSNCRFDYIYRNFIYRFLYMINGVYNNQYKKIQDFTDNLSRIMELLSLYKSSFYLWLKNPNTYKPDEAQIKKRFICIYNFIIFLFKLSITEKWEIICTHDNLNKFSLAAVTGIDNDDLINYNYEDEDVEYILDNVVSLKEAKEQLKDAEETLRFFLFRKKKEDLNKFKSRRINRRFFMIDDPHRHFKFKGELIKGDAKWAFI